uniref:Uncharacterized protein n=1 Tax=Oryza meridionalis TaxID=40149 RepID=A0A0E0CI25_9ORYZ
MGLIPASPFVSPSRRAASGISSPRRLAVGDDVPSAKVSSCYEESGAVGNRGDVTEGAPSYQMKLLITVC